MGDVDCGKASATAPHHPSLITHHSLPITLSRMKEARPDEPDGAISALLARWDSTDAPPWAETLTGQIIGAIEGSRQEDIRTAIAEALAEQARLDADAARRGGGKAPRNDTPPAGGARRRPRSSK